MSYGGSPLLLLLSAAAAFGVLVSHTDSAVPENTLTMTPAESSTEPTSPAGAASASPAASHGGGGSTPLGTFSVQSTPIPAQVAIPRTGRPIPHDGDPDFKYLANGGFRRSFVWRNPANAAETRVWWVKDGGQIGHSRDGGTTVVYQETPQEAAQMLLDIKFLDDGKTGWACGRSGHVLKTVDAGTTWRPLNADNATVSDTNGDPAVLWALKFFEDDPKVGIVAGLWNFQSTADGGRTWSDLELYRDAAHTELISLHHVDLSQTMLELRRRALGRGLDLDLRVEHVGLLLQQVHRMHVSVARAVCSRPPKSAPC